MPLNKERARQYLKEFDFKTLFIEELGWDRNSTGFEVTINNKIFQLNAIAEKRGMVAFTCSPLADGHIPEYSLRRKIERDVAKSIRENLIVYTDADKTKQTWQWVKREVGRPDACREHSFNSDQSGEALIQKLQAISFSIDEEDGLTITHVTGRVRIDVERVTKRFYERFQKEHTAFLKFIKNIADEEMERWYASVMINRLMFIYFIEKKSFLNNDKNYLRNKLIQSQQRGQDLYYREFLCPLFFEGFAKKETDRTTAINQLLGKIPYLNGGIFQQHQVEELYGKEIRIADTAFENLFNFFEQYQWHLDERPLKDDKEINPDVLGYIFERYINQKQMGAYYTKEDITEYISKNTLIPFLFDAARQKCKIAFEGEHNLWQLAQSDPDRYIYLAVRKGVEHALPPHIAVGLNDISQRTEWNRPAEEMYALPTEIWREVVARRNRYEEVRAKLVAGEIRSINDFITHNLYIRQLAQDVIENSEGPELLRAFYQAIEKVSVLDPTCGSGAFLFAALNTLEPLYEACLERMQIFLDELDRSDKKQHPEKFSDFRKIIDQIKKHPSRSYFIYKSIIINNLYGVDIMEEAIEICKLRLFLKLVAQVDEVEKLEPLPDIDFNIRAGNTLVGFANYDEVEKAVTSKFDFENSMDRIKEKAEDIDRLFERFRQQQTEIGGEVTPLDKQELRKRLGALEDELNLYLAGEYGIIDLDPDDKEPAYEKWLSSHKPFHWFIEFHSIIKKGGFDVIIGNPPYVEYRNITRDYYLQKGLYKSETVSNLYAFCVERAKNLLNDTSWFGMIIPSGFLGLDDALKLRNLVLESYKRIFCSSYSIRPSQLFEGVDQRLCICLTTKAGSDNSCKLKATRFYHWNAEERPILFPNISYNYSFSHPRLNRIVQIGSNEALAIFQKIESKNNKLIRDYYASKYNGFKIHYHRSPRYWVRAMDFEQYFKSPTRERSVHHFRDLYFLNLEIAKAINTILNSSLFFFWFISIGNGRNITGTDVELFPVGDFSSEFLKKIVVNSDNLMLDYKKNSFIRTRQDCEYQEFKVNKSKPIIDKIDRILAKHYGFTDEELDFIINYDIKYRMGRDADDGED